MGLFEFRKPKWRHKDPTVRLASVDGIDPGNVELLESLGRGDTDREVRWAAINRLADLNSLSRLEHDAAPDDLPVVTARINLLLYNQVVGSQDPEGWRDSLAKITAPGLLAKLAVQGDQPAIRLAAVNRIDDQQLLAAIVKQNCGKQPAVAALSKITDETLLAELGEHAASKTARRLAAEKIAEIERKRNPLSEREIIARQLDSLAAEAVRLQESPDIDAAVARLTAIRQEWQVLDPENIHPASPSVWEICQDVEERFQETLLRRKMGQEKAARFDRFQARLAELCVLIERLACSTADDAQSVKDNAVMEWEPLVNEQKEEMVPSPRLAKRFADACRAFDANREKIEAERLDVATIEKQYAEIRELVAGQDLKKAALRLAAAEKILAPLKFNFFSKPAVEKPLHDLAVELHQAQTAIRSQSLSKRREICTELEKLSDSGEPGQIGRQLHTLTQEWQQLAKLDGEEGRNLEQQFQRIASTLTERLKTLEHEQDWQLWANLTLKEKLTDRVVALDQEQNLETVFRVIKEAQDEWKAIGPVPPKESQKLWETFHNACNRNFERAKPLLEEQKTRRIEAMDRRREICALAAEMAESTDWQQTTHAIKGFQEEWKTLPHGSRKEEKELYQQFREACDRFFARRQEHYQRQDEERRSNLTEKVKLCEEAEQLAAAPQLDYPKKFKLLQSEWKQIGPAPRQKEGAVWQRFRTACDTFFNWLAAEQQQNLQRKEELCEAAEKIVAEASAEDNRKEIVAKLTELQLQWKEIGPVPPDRSETVWQRFRKPCDEFFAARQQEFAQEEEVRRANQDKKEEILARAQELAGRSKDKESAAQLQQLQKEWFETGPAPKENNRELNDSFKSLCNAFFEDRRQYFTDLKAQQLENQKKKESLCLRLENIVGLSYQPAGGEKGKALSLAEELKQAMEDNFMLAGRRQEKKGVSDEIKRIEQEWQKIGPVPPRLYRPLTDRYKKALDAYYKRQRPSQ